MNTKTAKDFLVQQVAEQAARESVPLSEIEKKMMYFTESDPLSCENPLEINDEFEKEYNDAEYEAKMSNLLHHTYERLKAEGTERKRDWDEAIRTLRKGDHYFLVLWNLKPAGERPPHDSVKLIASALVLIATMVPLFWLAAKYNIDLDRYKYLLYGLFAVLAVGIWKVSQYF